MKDASTLENSGGTLNVFGLESFLGRPASMVSRLGSLLSPGLVPDSSLRWALGIAEAMPSVFDAFGFEAYLGRPVADFALRLCLTPSSARDLDEAFSAGGALNARSHLPGWRALRATAQDLLREDSRFRSDVSVLWVTFERPNAEPDPALHACLDADLVFHGESEPLDAARVFQKQAALAHIGDLWRPPEARASPMESLSRAATWLTGRGRIAHVSFAPSRGSEAWKTSLMIRKDALTDFLNETGWAGDRAMLAHAVNLFCPDGDVLRTGRTAGPGPERRFGLEIFSGGPIEDGQERERILSSLVDLGLCSPAERAALQQWQGVSLEIDRLTGRLFMAVRKWYVKVVLDERAQLSCKAYLVWLPITPEPKC